MICTSCAARIWYAGALRCRVTGTYYFDWPWSANGMNDDDIINERIRGHSAHAIAKTRRTSVADIDAVIDRWAS